MSWGDSPSIRIWTRDGDPWSGSGSEAHYCGTVFGVVAVDDWLVSWGRDGAIRVWSLDGRQPSSGDAEAHRHGVHVVRVLDDRMVSWAQIVGPPPALSGVAGVAASWQQ